MFVVGFCSCIEKAKSLALDSLAFESPSLELEIGESHKLNVLHTPSELKAPTYSWSSSDPSVATVASDGTVSTLTEGITTIKVEGIGTDLFAQCRVTVVPVRAKKVVFDDDIFLMILNGRTTNFSVLPNAIVLPENAPHKELLWSVEDPEIAEIIPFPLGPSERLVIQPLKVGSTKLIATVEGTTVSGSILVVVREPEKVVSLHLEEPGTLQDKLGNIYPADIISLTVTGYIDARDFSVMRGMASGAVLDISNTEIYAVTYQERDYPANEFPYIGLRNNSLSVLCFPDGITSIGEGALYGSTLITTITLPENITHIGREAFRSCSELQSIYLPENINWIGERAFRQCTSLEEIVLPSQLEVIQKMTFYNCEKLKKITIPASVNLIEDEAFGACYSLEEMYVLSETPPVISEEHFNFTTLIEQCKLYVPSGAIDAYRQHPVWGQFEQTIVYPE